jgi:hypothetical protein
LLLKIVEKEMARTHSDYETWDDDSFEEKLRRGHVSTMSRRMKGDGSQRFDDAWGKRSKRHAKKTEIRAKRRRLKEEPTWE